MRLAFGSPVGKILVYGAQHDASPAAYQDTWSWKYGTGGWVFESELGSVQTPCVWP
jgi:hypothetical protein